MKKLIRTSAQASAILLSSAFLFSCDIDAQKGRAMSDDPGTEYAPQMYNSIPYESLKQEEDNKYNPSGMNMRVPARNTIARGKMAFNDYSNDTSSMDVMGSGLVNPLRANDAAMVEDGEVLYVRFCAPCHGYDGQGGGTVPKRVEQSGKAWIPANLVQPDFVLQPNGQLFNTISNGRNTMLGYASQIPVEDRWAIVLYVRALQRSQHP